MAGFEYGESLMCLVRVKIGNQAFEPGSIFPYADLNVEPALLDSLLNQRKVAREAQVSKKMLEEIQRDKTAKIIRNFPDGRVAISWPRGEELPDGVLDGRPEHLRSVAIDTPQEDPEAEEEPDSVDDEVPETEDDPEPEEDQPQEPEDENENQSVEIVAADGIGWFNVLVDGIPVNTKKLRKKEALKLREEYL